MIISSHEPFGCFHKMDFMNPYLSDVWPCTMHSGNALSPLLQEHGLYLRTDIL